MPRIITKDDIDALWAAYNEQGLSDKDREVLLAFKDSIHRVYLEKKIEQWAKDPEMPEHAEIGPIFLDGFRLGMAWSETERLEDLMLLLAEPGPPPIWDGKASSGGTFERGE